MIKCKYCKKEYDDMDKKNWYCQIPRCPHCGDFKQSYDMPY